MLVYTNDITPRKEYIISVLLGAIGSPGYRFTSKIREFKEAPGARINYSASSITEKELWIAPVKLLSESTVQQQNLEVYDWQGVKAFYKTTDGDLGFDMFAASFFLLSRYEEYLPHTLDMYGRYAHENSLAFKYGFLNLPLVNIWLQKFTQLLCQKFPELDISAGPFSFIPTYDIDIAWSYAHKGFIRNAGGLAREMADAKFTTAGQRLNVLSGNRKDPFDSYDFLDHLHTIYGVKPIYFFHVARKNKAYDRNILPDNKAFKDLVKQHAAKYDIGVHPSWQSGDDYALLPAEIQTLEKLAEKKITRSRQHYLRFHLPKTYQRLLAAGIKEDYSMGYGTINGFRASWCLPFKWYDLQGETTTNLTVFPFCFMDANAFFEQNLNTEEAFAELMNYYCLVKMVNGVLITIWHNHFLGTDTLFTGWKELYKTFLENIEI